MKLEGKFWLVLFAMGMHNDLEGQYELVHDPEGTDEPPYSNDEGCTQFHVEFVVVGDYPQMKVLDG